MRVANTVSEEMLLLKSKGRTRKNDRHTQYMRF